MAYSYKIPKWKVDVWKRKSKTPKSFFENIGKEQGLTGDQLNDFTTFMQLRFPYETDERYTTEWVGRFKTGNPEGYMDSHSLAVYKKIKKSN